VRYASFDHAGWVARHTGQEPSPLGSKVADILGIAGGGIYNAPLNHGRVDWTDERVVSVVWQSELATFDAGGLSLLVFLCHEARIRCAIEGCGPRLMRLRFTQRKAEGWHGENHPSLAEAVERFAATFPVDHRIFYRPAPPGEAGDER
jgi:hypothetical protein